MIFKVELNESHNIAFCINVPQIYFLKKLWFQSKLVLFMMCEYEME
jgi:hypothetical protein